MSLPCPKCNRETPYKEEWKWSPPEVNFVYACCGARRILLYDSIHGWETRKARQERLKVKIICTRCKQPFIQSSIEETRKKKSVCEKCHARLQREANQRRESL